MTIRTATESELQIVTNLVQKADIQNPLSSLTSSVSSSQLARIRNSLHGIMVCHNSAPWPTPFFFY